MTTGNTGSRFTGSCRTSPSLPGDRAYDLVSWVENRLDLFASTPMLIVWGMRDFVFDHTFLDEWTRRFPHAQVHRFAQAGHYVLEDEPESIIALVQSFLAARRSGGANMMSRTWELLGTALLTGCRADLSRTRGKRQGWLGRYAPGGTDRGIGTPVVSLRSTTATPIQHSHVLFSLLGPLKGGAPETLRDLLNAL